ncbi:MAG: hypothetical protein OJF47_000704 [Nitrospira sp.]|nr:MAG: hypothetical protein OJF47_000704 [Nitrospira sp.]
MTVRCRNDIHADGIGDRLNAETMIPSSSHKVFDSGILV